MNCVILVPAISSTVLIFAHLDVAGYRLTAGASVHTVWQPSGTAMFNFVRTNAMATTLTVRPSVDIQIFVAGNSWTTTASTSVSTIAAASVR